MTRALQAVYFKQSNFKVAIYEPRGFNFKSCIVAVVVLK